MSTVSTPRVAKRGTKKPDLFRYGWRFVRVFAPDGTEALDQVPLTLEDVLHPELGDYIVQSDPHDDDLNYLKDVFKSRLVAKVRATVVSDCRVNWNLSGVRPLAPDIAVFSSVKRRRPWVTLDVAADGAKPALVIEVTSPDTRSNDLVIKVDYYYRARVPLYVIVDAVQDDGENRHLRLIGYRRARGGYRQIVPDARGWLWLQPVRLWLGVVRDVRLGYDRVACFDPETGEEVGDYTALREALILEKKARVRAERLAKIEAGARARAERRADAEASRANKEATRANKEATRANKEALARAAAEKRIRELEAAMRKSRKDA